MATPGHAINDASINEFGESDYTLWEGFDQPSQLLFEQLGNHPIHNQSAAITQGAQRADSFRLGVPSDSVPHMTNAETSELNWNAVSGMSENYPQFLVLHPLFGDGRTDNRSASPAAQDFSKPVSSISPQYRPGKKRRTNTLSRSLRRQASNANVVPGAIATDSRKRQRIQKGSSPTKALSLDAIKGCEALFAKHGRKIPPRERIKALSDAFDVDRDCMVTWFRSQEDSGYRTMSLSASDRENALRYRHFQSCRRRKHPGKERNSTDSYYPCASQCGAMSQKKGDWKRHEKQHWPPEIWICRHIGCMSRRGKEHVWIRRDKFQDHLRSLGQTLSKSELDNKAVPVDSHFSRKCHIGSCGAIFTCFDERCEHIFETHLVTGDPSEWREPEKTCDCDETPFTSISKDNYNDSNSETSSSNEDQPTEGPGGGDGADTNQGYRHGGNRSHRGSDTQQPNSDSPFAWSPNKQQRLPSQSFQNIYRPQLWTPYTIVPETSLECSAPLVEDIASPRQSNRLAVIHSGYLGSGGSAQVDELRFSNPALTLARKTIHCLAPEQKRRAVREVLVMSRLNHPHAVSLVAACMEQQSVQILMEPAAEYNLSQLLFTPLEGSAMRGQASFWFSCLANALNYIHESGIRHLDIKPSNILIFDSNVYIADFGTSNFVDDTKSISSESEAITRRYAAPEIWRGERGRASDIFALGCVYLELLVALLHRTSHGSDAFDCNDSSRNNHVSTYSGNLGSVVERIAELRRSVSSSGNVAFFNLVLDCCYSAINFNPRERPTAADLASLLAAQSCYHLPIQAQLTRIDDSVTSTVYLSDALHEAHVPPLTDSCHNGTEISYSPENTPALAMFSLPGVADNQHPTQKEGWISVDEHPRSITSFPDGPQKPFSYDYNLSLSDSEAQLGQTTEADLDLQSCTLHYRIISSPEYHKIASTNAYKGPVMQVSPSSSAMMGQKSMLHFWLEDFSWDYETFLFTGCSERQKRVWCRGFLRNFD